MESNRPNLLFLSLVEPSLHSNGPAQRAYFTLQAFSRFYDIHLVILEVGFYEKPRSTGPDPLPCQSMTNIQVPMGLDCGYFTRRGIFRLSPQLFFSLYQQPSSERFFSEMTAVQLATKLAGTPFDILHGFRLYTLPWAKIIATRLKIPLLQIDLDDLESHTRKRLADLYRSRHLRHLAAQFEADAQEFLKVEHTLDRSCRRVFVCSELDRHHLQRQLSTLDVVVLPNVVRLPEVQPLQRKHRSFTFLFVGTLGYFPNQDALEYFCATSWPMIVSRAQGAVELCIVGDGLPSHIKTWLARQPGVVLSGWVANLEDVYARADAVVIPLRAGGGTRIKLLEAMAYGVPVVSTSLGAEGIEVQPGTHAILADTPEAFAASCLRLLEDTALRTHLAQSGKALVNALYTEDALIRQIGALG
ncbi:MAG TPA: glycosyltransferase [Acidobacteriota bacterium]|nr:glycosyltransferase [Acidobacteriota bacterium]